MLVSSGSEPNKKDHGINPASKIETKLNPLVPANCWLALACGVEGFKEGSLDLLNPQRRHHVDLDLVAKAEDHQRPVEGVLAKKYGTFPLFFEEVTFCRFNFVFGPKVLQDFCPAMRKDYFILNSEAFPPLYKVD